MRMEQTEVRPRLHEPMHYGKAGPVCGAEPTPEVDVCYTEDLGWVDCRKCKRLADTTVDYWLKKG